TAALGVDGDGGWARRAIPLADAVMGDDAAGRALERLSAARLVTVGHDSVELAHESLLSGWPRLRGWLTERAVVAEQLEHIAAAAYRLQDSPDTRGALLTAVQRDSGVLFRVHADNRLDWMGTTSNGHVLVMDNTRTVLTLDPARRRLVPSYAVPAATVSDVS